MVKKLLVALLAFAVCAVAVYAACAAIGAENDVSLPKSITEDSPCPVVYCASGECHGFDNVPAPDGIHEMKCPEVNCYSAECHAWETLASRYHQASNGSLNLWVLAPVMLVLGLVLIVKRVGNKNE